jgi:hypothetical protein
MDEREKKAFDFAADLSKQLITLSTGIVTITLLLSKDIAEPRAIAVAAWAFYLLSTLCGLWALMALTGTLAPINKLKPKTDVTVTSAQAVSSVSNDDEGLEIGGNVRKPAGLQIFAFGVATLLTLAYVFVALASPRKVTPPSQMICNCQSQPNLPTQ